MFIPRAAFFDKERTGIATLPRSMYAVEVRENSGLTVKRCRSGGQNGGQKSAREPYVRSLPYVWLSSNTCLSKQIWLSLELTFRHHPTSHCLPPGKSLSGISLKIKWLEFQEITGILFSYSLCGRKQKRRRSDRIRA
jgi:hypothetical protein